MGRFFSIGELCRSNVADLKGIPNVPNVGQRMNLEALIERVLDPLRAAYGKPVYVNSGFRSETLNGVIGGAKNSQHMRGQAADIRAGEAKDNRWLFEYIRDCLEYDQLIWEKGNDSFPQWVHVSYNGDNNRGEVLRIR